MTFVLWSGWERGLSLLGLYFGSSFLLLISVSALSVWCNPSPLLMARVLLAFVSHTALYFLGSPLGGRLFIVMLLLYVILLEVLGLKENKL